MLDNVIRVTVYLISFIVSFYALSSIRFDLITDVRKPAKVQSLLFLLSMGLAYLVGQFLLSFMTWNS